MSFTGRVFLLIATLGILHAAFSTYEHLSQLKALERPEGPIPPDIAVETLVALVLGILGACLNAPPLKDITWSSEMRKHTIDQMDSRLGFASYVNRGNHLLSRAPTSSSRK
ncbi:membrane magnesium transporter-domain-containing protein [Panaeolus papilionaceus]|nr:membrane magnesium transporter-domain-containing protein [Panaeolus papilionaceus]